MRTGFAGAGCHNTPSLPFTSVVPGAFPTIAMAVPIGRCRKSGIWSPLESTLVSGPKGKVAETRQTNLTNPQQKTWPKSVIDRRFYGIRASKLPGVPGTMYWRRPSETLFWSMEVNDVCRIGRYIDLVPPPCALRLACTDWLSRFSFAHPRSPQGRLVPSRWMSVTP